MIDTAMHVCMSRLPGQAIAHGRNALSISLTDVIGIAGTLETRVRFTAQGTSVPISRGSPSV